jgi:hypothetical protein
LSGHELKATVRLDGPVAPVDAASGNALQEAIEEYEKVAKKAADGEKTDIISLEEVVDFEHLNLKDQFVEEEEDDDELAKAKDKDLSPSERKKIKDKQRKKILVKRQRQEQQRLHQHKKVREEGQAYQTTIKAPKAGWYRFCVVGSWHQVSVFNSA